LIKVIEEARRIMKNNECFRSFHFYFFLALIPKKDKLKSYGDFKLISPCTNCIYKTMAKTIVVMVKKIILEVLLIRTVWVFRWEVDT
jgi:hypothetical protein